MNPAGNSVRRVDNSDQLLLRHRSDRLGNRPCRGRDAARHQEKTNGARDYQTAVSHTDDTLMSLFSLMFSIVFSLPGIFLTQSILDAVTDLTRQLPAGRIDIITARLSASWQQVPRFRSLLLKMPDGLERRAFEFGARKRIEWNEIYFRRLVLEQSAAN